MNASEPDMSLPTEEDVRRLINELAQLVIDSADIPPRIEVLRTVAPGTDLLRSVRNGLVCTLTSHLDKKRALLLTREREISTQLALLHRGSVEPTWLDARDGTLAAWRSHLSTIRDELSAREGASHLDPARARRFDYLDYEERTRTETLRERELKVLMQFVEAVVAEI